MSASTSGADSAARVSFDQTRFASELRYHTDGLALVGLSWDDHGRLRVTLPDGVHIDVDGDWLARAGAAGPARVAGRCHDAWRLHLERAGAGVLS